MHSPTTPRPIAIPVSLAVIPEALQAKPQWVGWRYECRDDTWTKPPINLLTGRHASDTNPTTWTTYQGAVQGYQQQAYDLDGIGYVLTEADALVGFDFDHCRHPDTGTLDAWAQDLVHLLDSYTEVSPSGTGLRVWTQGTFADEKRGRKHGDIEMYRGQRFLTLTGCHLDGTPLTIEPRHAAIEAVYARYFPRPTRTAGDPQTNGPRPTLADDALLAQALQARNGGKLARLLAGDRRGYPSPSEADLALCSVLAFWTADASQIDRLVRGSALYREKWDRDDYRDATITKALQRTTESWTPRPPWHGLPVRRVSPQSWQQLPVMLVKEVDVCQL